MKTPTIRLRRALQVTMYDVLKRYNKLNGLEKNALKEEYKEWIDALEGNKAPPYVLYVNQINID